MDPMLHYYNELERHVLSYNPALDKTLLYKAYCYAAPKPMRDRPERMVPPTSPILWLWPTSWPT